MQQDIRPDRGGPGENLIADAVETIVRELCEERVMPGQIVVFGVSTSEVSGKKIGTAGARETAEQIYLGIERVRRSFGFYPAFQCCEHLNRSLVVERELLGRYPMLEEVAVIPVPKAGGSMAAYAYGQLNRPCLVEHIAAHAGIDIGDTLIGMHLRPVAVPLRPSIRTIGEAHVNMAYTRPKLIGGERAVYRNTEQGTPEAGKPLPEPDRCE